MFIMQNNIRQKLLSPNPNIGAADMGTVALMQIRIICIFNWISFRNKLLSKKHPYTQGAR